MPKSTISLSEEKLADSTMQESRLQPSLPAYQVESISADPAGLPQSDSNLVLRVPFRLEEDSQGWLEFSGEPGWEWSEEERRLVEQVAAQLSLALENARLLGEIRRRASYLETAAQIARETSSTLALEALLQGAVDMVHDRFGFSHASIFLLDESHQNAIVQSATGQAGAEMVQERHSLPVGSRSIIGYVTSTGDSLVVNDVLHDPIHRPNPHLPETRAELGIPLKIGVQVIGALDVQSNQANAFHSDDIGVLQILADQIAVAINNARLYEEQRQTTDRLREVDRLKTQFLANMSHELRTPLNSIIGFSRVILKGIDGPINATQEQDLSAIHASGQHLLSMINNILDLSKIEAGKMEIAVEQVDLAGLVESALPTARGLLKDKPIELSVEIPADLPMVLADPLKLRQVLINLLSNAVKFTAAGSITLSAAVQVGAQGQPEARVSVSDTGPGISAQDQAKLFERFSQVDASPTRETSGTGLGLSICRALIELHGGRIGVESQPGNGSTFWFTLAVGSDSGKHLSQEVHPN